MSSTNGQNIATAVKVLYKTYEHLNRMFSEMDRIAMEEGFVSLTPKFLRWKSDAWTNGWLLSNFIKLYQRSSDPVFGTGHSSQVIQEAELRDGAVYGIEVDLDDVDEFSYPVLTVFKNEYDFSEWNRMPQVSDHSIFYYPIHDNDCFSYTCDEDKDNLWHAVANEKGKKKYWGIQQAHQLQIPLTSITNIETIRIEIFERFRNLP